MRYYYQRHISRDEHEYVHKKTSLPLQYNLLLPIMRQRRARSPDPRKKILLKIRVTRLCARRSRTPGLFQLSRNYCPSALRSLVNIFPFMPWFLAKGSQRRVPSRQSYDALIKNYHPPTTKGALARHSLSLFPSLDRYSPPSPFSSSSFSFSSRRHFVFLFISPWSPRKLNKPRPLSLQSRKLGRRIKSYSFPLSPSPSSYSFA